MSITIQLDQHQIARALRDTRLAYRTLSRMAYDGPGERWLDDIGWQAHDHHEDDSERVASMLRDIADRIEARGTEPDDPPED